MRADRQRYGAHTDYDGFTILCKANPGEEGAPGMEIQLVSGEWVAVCPPADTLLVNIGDLMARWTNDRWRATMHRVARPVLGTADSPTPPTHTLFPCTGHCILYSTGAR